MQRLSLLGGSTFATALTISYAWSTRNDFYNTVIFLSTNNFAKLILGCLAFSLTITLGSAVRKLFLGGLRPAEAEALYENSRYAVMEMCMALTIFREEISVRILGLFVLLLFFKSFHWLIRLRVEHVEQMDMLSRFAHLRLASLHLFLFLIDVSLVNTSFSLLANQEPNVLILFAFEFAILGLAVCSTFCRYLLHFVDVQMDGRWQTKHTYLFFIEFGTDVLRFFFYFIFFSVVFLYYGMPIYIMRDLWVAYTNIRSRIQKYVRYRKLTSNMDEKFPNATDEELESCEHTCIICRDTMDVGKRLPCGHIYHSSCLQVWLQQQQTCPTCRVDIPSSLPVQRSVQRSRISEDQVNVTPTGGSSNTGTNANESSQSSNYDTPKQTQTKALRVVENEARIYNVPSCVEGTLIVRRIKNGTFLLILGETCSPIGEHFFRVMDGWVPEIELGLTIVERLSLPKRMCCLPSPSPPCYSSPSSLCQNSPIRQISLTPVVTRTDSSAQHKHKQGERPSSSFPTPSSDDHVLNQQLSIERQLANIKYQMDELKQQNMSSHRPFTTDFQSTTEVLDREIALNEQDIDTLLETREPPVLCNDNEPSELHQKEDNAD